MLEAFFNLSAKKQATILNAAFKCFGAQGYKKASMNDIASAAHISKPALFHYFGTKKNLYLYALQRCAEIFIAALSDGFEPATDDFFERILLATDIKIALLKKHPALLAFLSAAYKETNKEVVTEIKELMAGAETNALREQIVFAGTDLTRFKDDVDPKLVLKMLMSMGYGYMNPTEPFSKEDLDTMREDFKQSVGLLKAHLYKEDVHE